MVLVGAPDAVHAHARSVDPEAFVAWSRAAVWTGHANQLSPSRVDWPLVDDVARATRRPRVTREWDVPSGVPSPGRADRVSGRQARDVIIARRSALGFDGHGTLPADVFHAMLDRLLPPSPPWDAVTWSPAAQLAIFVHRVAGMTSGLYFFGRDQTVARAMRDAMRPEFLWEAVTDRLSLLVPIDCGPIAQRLSCDQDIARDGFFSLAMLVPFAQTLESDGDWGYRRLFWDCGMVGQVLYLEAEAAGARGTGIGCFYDDPVHDLLGLRDSTFQSLYHFSMGVPIEDARLGTEPGYSWELPISSQMRRASSDPSHDR